jgi:hypothetical protein
MPLILLAFAELLVAEGLPMRLIESEYMRRFIRIMCPKFESPNRNTLTEDLILKTFAGHINSHLRRDIEVVEAVSVMTDRCQR